MSYVWVQKYFQYLLQNEVIVIVRNSGAALLESLMTEQPGQVGGERWVIQAMSSLLALQREGCRNPRSARPEIWFSVLTLPSLLLSTSNQSKSTVGAPKCFGSSAHSLFFFFFY